MVVSATLGLPSTKPSSLDPIRLVAGQPPMVTNSLNVVGGTSQSIARRYTRLPTPPAPVFSIITSTRYRLFDTDGAKSWVSCSESAPSAISVTDVAALPVEAASVPAPVTVSPEETMLENPKSSPASANSPVDISATPHPSQAQPGASTSPEEAVVPRKVSPIEPQLNGPVVNDVRSRSMRHEGCCACCN